MYCLLQSYSRRRAFVAAQSPLESTRADVWELVWQFNIKTVVLLCPLKEGKKVGALIMEHVQYMQCLLVQNCARFYRTNCTDITGNVQPVLA